MDLSRRSFIKYTASIITTTSVGLIVPTIFNEKIVINDADVNTINEIMVDYMEKNTVRSKEGLSLAIKDRFPNLAFRIDMEGDRSFFYGCGTIIDCYPAHEDADRKQAIQKYVDYISQVEENANKYYPPDPQVEKLASQLTKVENNFATEMNRILKTDIPS